MTHSTRRYRATFDGTRRDLDEFCDLIAHAAQHAFAVDLVEVVSTSSSSDGDLHSHEVIFEIGVTDPDNAGLDSPENRMLEHLDDGVQLDALE